MSSLEFKALMALRIEYFERMKEIVQKYLNSNPNNIEAKITLKEISKAIEYFKFIKNDDVKNAYHLLEAVSKIMKKYLSLRDYEKYFFPHKKVLIEEYKKLAN